MLAHITAGCIFKEGTVKGFLRLIPVLTLLGAPLLTPGCSQPANQPDVEARVNDQLKAGKLDDKVKVLCN